LSSLSSCCTNTVSLPVLSSRTVVVPLKVHFIIRRRRQPIVLFACRRILCAVVFSSWSRVIYLSVRQSAVVRSLTADVLSTVDRGPSGLAVAAAAFTRAAAAVDDAAAAGQ